MAIKVQTGCRDCRKCTNSGVANLARDTGRATAAVMTAGISEVGFAFTKKCRGCGHQMSLHGYTATPQPTMNVQAPPSAPLTPSAAAGWYPDPYGHHEQRYWDGWTWTEHISGATAPGLQTPKLASPASDKVTQLRELANLRDDGVLTDEEFAAEKAKILGS